jgi:S1-C subfamily serine protease
MRRAAILLVLSAAASGWAGQGQGQSTLRITVALVDDAQAVTPVSRHTLFVSDNPATREPRRIVTAADGTATVNLPPGSYIVESDRPVTFAGRAYQWTQVVTIVAGRDLTLALTAANAEIVPVTATPSGPSSSVERERTTVIDKWQDSVVAVWSPTRRASGFVVDRRGLIATDQHAIGTAEAVELQLTPEVKVPARVLAADRARDVAIVWVAPAVIADRSPVPLPCPPAPVPSLEERQEIVAIEAPHQADTTLEDGEVTALQPRHADTDLRLSFGGAGGPVFNQAGVLVGLTSLAPDATTRRGAVVRIVRTVFLCEALAASLPQLAETAPLEPSRLPVDPPKSYPAAALDASRKTSGAAAPPVLSSSNFEIALLTPPMVHRAEQSGRTGGTRTRSLEAEARLGRLTEFGEWSEYFATVPPVLVVRVTPKLVEGFWKRLGREAARVQGAVLPPFKDFKTSFRRLRATCGSDDVMPIHPLVLEHRVSEKNVIREGLYVFDPDAFGPHCTTVTLSLYSEAQPEKGDTVTVMPAVIDRIWQDFASYRALRPTSPASASRTPDPSHASRAARSSAPDRRGSGSSRR